MSEKMVSPISPISPISTTATRSATLDSTHAIPLESGDVGGLLVERLRAWKHAVGYLEAYFTQTEAVHKTLAKEYQKVLKTVDEPLREGHHFAASVGGVASFFENVRANTVRLASSHAETAAELKTAVIPILGRLHKEIKDRAKHVQSESEKSAKGVLKARTATQTHIDLLGTYCATGDSAGGSLAGRAKPEHDPFIVKKALLHKLAKQVAEENNQRQDLISVQTHTQQFEQHVLATVKEALAIFNQVMATQADLQKTLYADVLGGFNRLRISCRC